ncbi:hypothetical protein [Lederbergia galactosidilytica]|uniref:Uncharacterized protein n=1 Tax=Lederbergia galactosidilytica TaxID=217031 RepID=A0A177ZSA2_9BACI|nr:hypothetical protein [Lederbergia galactosidilytica]KRG12760.1 hypothetical protein ACA30_17805 [Virgibacillus soli]MBP1917047.1 hypothetical protein [Lederbergia galactosidilytica]OAK70523.1 hypothetical protein ABB05_12240 [Lederbergia galactosidilytica]
MIVSATLFIFRNVSHLIIAAVMGRKEGILGEGMFNYALEVTHSYSKIPEIVVFVIGLIYLVYAEIKKEK